MHPEHVIDPDRARWVLLLIGLAALVLAGGLIFVIHRLRARYRAGREAIDQLRGGARGMQLQMEATAESAGAQLTRKPGSGE